MSSGKQDSILIRKTIFAVLFFALSWQVEAH